MSEPTFTPEIYEQIRDGAQRSAFVLTPIIRRAVGFTNLVVDVGCGEGWFAREFFGAGSDVLALDESADPALSEVGPRSRLDFRRVDLNVPGWAMKARDECRTIHRAQGFDLALCLEVAEHLPEESARSLIASLVSLAATVVFSAAIPGQGGHLHINEQWPSYWAALFNEHGYTVLDCFRPLIWENDNVEPWYRQNLLLFSREPRPIPAHPLDIVHPVLFDYHVGLRFDALQAAVEWRDRYEKLAAER